MTGNKKQHLEQQLWNIANTLREKMGADDFRILKMKKFMEVFVKAMAV